MAGDTHSAVDQAAIKATFPPPCQRISGQPTLLDLLSIFRHIVKCAGTFSSRFDELNLLYVAVPSGPWPRFSSRNYPALPQDPGDQPQYNITGSQAENNACKDSWQLARKYCAKDKHMNRVLIDRFLHLLDDTFTTMFKENQLLMQHKMRFQDAFNYFFRIYGTPDERVDEQNSVRMKKKWVPQQGIDALTNHAD